MVGYNFSAKASKTEILNLHRHRRQTRGSKMSDDIWATVVVALASIIGILITQIWSFRSSKASFVFQTRAGFLQEAYSAREFASF
jgi:hypothetical protein